MAAVTVKERIVGEVTVTDSSRVDPAVFVPGNIWAEMGARPHDHLVSVVAGRPIVFLRTHHIPGHSPHGTWAVCSAELARQVLLDTETFTSTHTTSLSNLLGGLDIIPIEADPPEHGMYRAIISEFFKPKAISTLTDAIKEQTGQLIDAFIADGRCEFVEQFGKMLPAAIFLSLYGLPPLEKRKFLELSNTVMGAPTAEERVNAMRAIRDLLAIELEDRKTSPTGDILSAYAHARFGDRPLTHSESLGGVMLLFTAGLDTVAALLGWVFRHLAEHPEDQQYLRENPGKMSGAIDEFLRYFSSVTVTRRATRDIELGGVLIRAGDTVTCPTTLLSRDPKEFENADALDIRKGARRHLAFGYGPHLCIGMHLARLEIQIALEAWLERVPGFRIEEDSPVTSHGGAVLALDTLPLRWD